MARSIVFNYNRTIHKWRQMSAYEETHAKAVTQNCTTMHFIERDFSD